MLVMATDRDIMCAVWQEQLGNQEARSSLLLLRM